MHIDDFETKKDIGDTITPIAIGITLKEGSHIAENRTNTCDVDCGCDDHCSCVGDYWD